MQLEIADITAFTSVSIMSPQVSRQVEAEDVKSNHIRMPTFIWDSADLRSIIPHFIIGLECKLKIKMSG